MRLRLITALSLILISLAGLFPTPARADAPTARLAFVGDIMLGREIGKAIAAHGAGYPLDAVIPYLVGADLAFGNLESPLTTAKRVSGGYDLHALPAYGEVVKRAGFDLVALANNHATDHGRDGLAETMKTLDGLGIAWIGAGRNSDQAHAARIETIRGLRIAFLAYEGLHATLPATASEAGTAWLEPAVAVKEIATARAKADLVVVSVHWGVEYQALPTPSQKALAQQMADAGADLIVGHHPHVVEPVEWVQGAGRARPTLVAYSLGNFLFDQGFQDDVMQSAVLQCEVGAGGIVAFGLLPIQMKPWQVVPADAANGRAVLGRLLPGQPISIWRTVPNAEQQPRLAVWWLEPAGIQSARAGELAAERTSALRRLAASQGWVVRAAGSSSASGRRAVAAVSVLPAWARDDQAGAAWGGQPRERLYLLDWTSSAWVPLSRWTLPHPVVELACQPGGRTDAVECAAIEELSDGSRRMFDWHFVGTTRLSVWSHPAGDRRSLLWWDADGDGKRELMANGG